MEFEEIYIDPITCIEDKKIQFSIKRIIDIILSSIGIIVMIPIFLIIILLVKIDSKGPCIFKQTRVGKNGKAFIIYKFRTMVLNAESKRELNIDPQNVENFVFQSTSDDRITKIGNFLRKSSLDETPQLLNVFIGNMSIVGPRPEIPAVVKYYSDIYRQRLFVTPGITGLAQVSGRGEIELGKTIYFDLSYIKEFSLWLDIKIFFKTIFSVFLGTGAV